MYKKYLLALLLIISAFNAVDGLALGLVLQEIKADLFLSDIQLGFVSGIAFALFYALMGIPIARWADRGNRVAILSISTCLWSIAVAACGVAQNFTQLVLIRIFVAVGEAGCIPPAYSLIADYFGRGERPRAVSRYLLSAPLSALIGYFAAGWLDQMIGWRAMFVVLSVPGLLLGALAWLTLKDPRCSGTSEAPAPSTYAATGFNQTSETQPGMKEVIATLWRSRAFRHLLMCISVMTLFGSGMSKWQPAFFVRSYGMHTGELGTWFTLVFGIGSFAGIYSGGELASRRAANKEGSQLRVVSIAYVAVGIVSACTYLSASSHVAFICMGIAAAGAAASIGPIFASIQTLVQERMRATSIAVIYLFSNLIGSGLGPMAAGGLSDALRPWLGNESLRYSLLALCPGYLWVAWHLWRASQTIASELDARESSGRDRRQEKITLSTSADARIC